MNYQSKTVVQLKEICKNKNISGYSKLNKKELISFIKKNLKKGGVDPVFESDHGDPVMKASKFLGEFNNNTVRLIQPKEKMFYVKYEKYEDLHDKLKYYFDNLFEFQKFKNFNNNNYFKTEELKKLTYIERYFLFLEEESSLFSHNNLLNYNHSTNKKINNKTEYYKVIYIKTENNHKRNTSYKYGKKTSNNIKIIKLQNNLSYINKMINYFNKYTYKSQTGSCMTGIRLRINKTKNNDFKNVFTRTKFNNEQFCIPTNNPYIQKIYVKNNKQNYHIGDEYELKKNNNNN